MAPSASNPLMGPTVRLAGFPVSLDAAFAFTLFSSLLFVSQFGAKSAAMFVLLVPLYIFVRRKDVLSAIWSNALLLILPAFALSSCLWSEAPGATLKYSIELMMTLFAAVLLSSARDQEAVLRGIAAAFLSYVAVAMVAGRSVGVGVGSGGEAFSGLTDSKNLIADIAATGIMVTVLVGMLALRKRDFIWMAIAAVGIAVDSRVLVAARSAGALLGLGIGLGAMFCLLLLVIMPPVVRALTTGFAALVLLVATLNFHEISAAVVAGGAAVFNKDPTLTGRTYLWYRADDLIREKPLLGRGYSAFWRQGNIDAEGLWRYAGITERSGFSFHNSGIQILVELGWIGLMLIATLVAVCAIVLLCRVVWRPNVFLCFWMALLFYELCRAPIEAVGVAPLYYSTILVFTALSAAFGRGYTLQRQKQGPTPRPSTYRTHVQPGGRRLLADALAPHP